MLTKDESERLWDLVKPLETGMLVTVEGETFQARPMHLVQKQFEGIFYFFSEHPSEKTTEIQHHQQVCLTFSCPKAQTYVSTSGNASISKDSKLIDELWNPFIEAWFPQGKNDPSVVLVAVEVFQAEYWQGKGNKVTQLFKYGKAYISGNKPNLGEHGHII